MHRLCVCAACDKSSPAVVVILQFKASYTLSEITNGVRSGMAQAIASVIGFSASAVVLNFTETSFQRRGFNLKFKLLQQRSVLVDVGLRDFQGSPALFSSSLTEGNINSQMSLLGLRSVQIVSNPGSYVTTSKSTSVASINISAVTTPESSTGGNNLMVAIIGSIAGTVAFIGSIAGTVYFVHSKCCKKGIQSVS